MKDSDEYEGKDRRLPRSDRLDDPRACQYKRDQSEAKYEEAERPKRVRERELTEESGLEEIFREKLATLLI